MLALASAFDMRGARGAELSFDDLLGTWCGSTADYVFTRERLTVLFHNGSAPRVLPIRRFALNAVGEGTIKVYWAIKRPDLSDEPNTVFYEFDAERHNMAQKANDSGDRGSRKAFHRC
jgi:hypothetical protein